MADEDEVETGDPENDDEIAAAAGAAEAQTQARINEADERASDVIEASKQELEESRQLAEQVTRGAMQTALGDKIAKLEERLDEWSAKTVTPEQLSQIQNEIRALSEQVATLQAPPEPVEIEVNENPTPPAETPPESEPEPQPAEQSSSTQATLTEAIDQTLAEQPKVTPSEPENSGATKDNPANGGRAKPRRSWI